MHDPDKPRLEALAHQGIEALRRNDAAPARAAFEAIVASGRATPQIWLFLAQACDLADDRPAARAALAQLLAADPQNPYALVMHGDLHSRDGNDRAAVNWYDRALSSAARLQNLPADLVQRLDRAQAARAAAAARFTAAMHASLAAAGATDAGPRFAEAIAIVGGDTRPYLQEPTSFYFPGLAATPFHDPADFAWAPALAAATAAITAEAAAVLADPAHLAPYVERPADRPAKPHALLDDPRWSAFHLFRSGEPIAANAARCPVTMAALPSAAIPVIAGASPMALFSILAPRTHIPPHNGMLNTRLIVHLPLIVPDNCRLRVGNTTRLVRAGELLIFDDSIEHEAWNDSDAPRAILLFEIWHPALTAPERRALTAMYESVSRYDEG